MQHNLVRKVSDELEIRNLIAKFAAASDEGTVEQYASLLSEDAVWTMAQAPGAETSFPAQTGRAAMVAGLIDRRAAKRGGPGSHTRHGLFPSIVEVTGDSASARTYTAYYRQTDAVPEIQSFAIYQDTFTRTVDGWKLSARRVDPA